MERATIRPAAGSLVRDPISGVALPPEGREVELTTYWRARLADGSAEIVKPTPTVTPDKPSEPGAPRGRRN